MPAVEEVMKIVRAMSEEERDLLFRLLADFDQSAWQRDRAEATRAFHAAGLTDDDIDQAVRPPRPRQGWAEACKELARRGDDLIPGCDSPALSSWDDEEWEW